MSCFSQLNDLHVLTRQFTPIFMDASNVPWIQSSNKGTLVGEETMPIYIWKGKNTYGEKRKGELEAVDQAAALSQLKRMRIADPTIKEKLDHD